eukprot:gene18167-19980_t
MPKFRCLSSKGSQKMKKQDKKSVDTAMQDYKWLEELHPRPTDLWIKKTVTLFTRFDKDGNGYLDDEDIDTFAAGFKKYGSLTTERAARMRDKIFTFWNLLNKGAKRVKLEQFVKGKMPLVLNPDLGAEIWERYLKQVGTLMFCSIDANEDGTISLQEFVLFFKCINVKEEYAREIFARLDANGDRQMSRDEFVEAFHGFLFSQDESASKELFGPLVQIEI